MKRQFGMVFVGLVAAAFVTPATAQGVERVVEASDDGCRIEVRGKDRALLMRSDADGNAEIGLMFAEPVATPGRTRDGYFYLGFGTSTSGPVAYRDGYEGEFSSGYIAEMGTADLWWMVDPIHGRLSLSVDSNTGFEAQTGDSVSEFNAFRDCLAALQE